MSSPTPRFGSLTSPGRAGAQPAAAGVPERRVDDPAFWTLAARTKDADGDPEGALEALTQALRLQPRQLDALLHKGRLLHDLGREREAAAAFEAALSMAPPFQTLTPERQTQVRFAYEQSKRWHERREAALQAALSERLGERLEGKAARRFRQSLEVMGGRRTIYRQQPHQYFFPEAPCIEFYDPDDFAWLSGVLAATDAIRAEFLAALAEDDGFAPYIAYPDDKPLDQWAELNRNPRWSAFHLLKDGERVEPNASRCPRTLAALGLAPQPHLAGRTPTAMYSLLRPKTRIPPHTGVTNARLVVHIPLVVPNGCGFRVGGETREWRVGEALIFDDSIEHEAWNHSEEPRCVLIFDIWNPYVREDEREMISAMYEALSAAEGGAGAGWSQG